MPKRLSTEEFITKAKTVHGDRYDYSMVEYINAHTDVTIVCVKHGQIKVKPYNHLFGYNCNECGTELGSGKQRKTNEQFIKDSQSVHGTAYDYTKCEYIGDNKKVEIVCPLHGSFWIRATNHFHGKQGCRACNMPKSKKCDEWLQSLNVPDGWKEKRLTINGKTVIVDAFDPNTNTVYEYWGDYWHGNPNKYSPTDINPHMNITYGELFDRTMKKRELICEKYVLVESWETALDPSHT